MIFSPCYCLALNNLFRPHAIRSCWILPFILISCEHCFRWCPVLRRLSKMQVQVDFIGGYLQDFRTRFKLLVNSKENRGQRATLSYKSGLWLWNRWRLSFREFCAFSPKFYFLSSNNTILMFQHSSRLAIQMCIDAIWALMLPCPSHWGSQAPAWHLLWLGWSPPDSMLGLKCRFFLQKSFFQFSQPNSLSNLTTSLSNFTIRQSNDPPQ